MDAIKYNPEGLTTFGLSEDELQYLKTYVENERTKRKSTNIKDIDGSGNTPVQSSEETPAGRDRPIEVQHSPDQGQAGSQPEVTNGTPKGIQLIE